MGDEIMEKKILKTHVICWWGKFNFVNIMGVFKEVLNFLLLI
jgi:hypothetical protein